MDARMADAVAHTVRAMARAEAQRVHWTVYRRALEAAALLLARLEASRDGDAFEGIIAALERRVEGESTQSRVDRGITETTRILEILHHGN